MTISAVNNHAMLAFRTNPLKSGQLQATSSIPELPVKGGGKPNSELLTVRADAAKMTSSGQNFMPGLEPRLQNPVKPIYGDDGRDIAKAKNAHFGSAKAAPLDDGVTVEPVTHNNDAAPFDETSPNNPVKPLYGDDGKNAVENAAAALATERAKAAIRVKVAEMHGNYAVETDLQKLPRPGVVPFRVGPNASPDVNSANALDGVAVKINVPKAFYDTLEQMIYKANQSANRMNPASRARVAEEFKQLSEQLNDMIEKYGIFEEKSLGFALGEMDISSSQGAAAAFHQLHGLHEYVDSINGINDNPVAGSDHGATLQALQQMANDSAGQMTDKQRADFNEKFKETVETYLKQLEDSGLIQYDAVMNVWRHHMHTLDISTQEGAQMAFNNLMNQENSINSLA